jgi:hypothetical protein
MCGCVRVDNKEGASFLYEFASDLIKWMNEEKQTEDFLEEFEPNSLGPKILIEKKACFVVLGVEMALFVALCFFLAIITH